MFITFEGPEGCGKSTHSTRLKTYLEGRGERVLLTREPGGTQIGKNIRDLLLDPRSVLDRTTEVYLFAADRSEHVAKIILPALKEGKIVISDRFIDSTIAYQIGGRQLPEDLVRYLNMVSAKGLVPDLTILLDVPPQVGLKRAAQKGAVDRFEKEVLDFHGRVREKYLEIARENPDRIKMIDTEKTTIEDIQEQIRKIIDEKC
ncbi:MAG: dTMP kinase [Candidatus Margulisbacteria bacterium]|nr:dTMP kinase [Candidatus Margulisiibacteriota bacterium]